MAREKPDLPDDPRKSLPDYKRDCPECGADHSIAEMDSEREGTGGKWMYRIDYWCPDCGGYVGGEQDYDGPVPVRTYNGTELH